MEWIKIGLGKAKSLLDKENAKILCAFDNGKYGFFDDETWPFAEVTHIVEIINPKESELQDV